MRSACSGVSAVRPEGRGGGGFGPDIPSGYASGVCGVESGECGAECDAAAGGREPQVEGETNEERRPRRMADPMKPTRREIEEHEITHLLSKLALGVPAG